MPQFPASIKWNSESHLPLRVRIEPAHSKLWRGARVTTILLSLFNSYLKDFQGQLWLHITFPLLTDFINFRGLTYRKTGPVGSLLQGASPKLSPLRGTKNYDLPAQWEGRPHPCPGPPTSLLLSKSWWKLPAKCFCREIHQAWPRAILNLQKSTSNGEKQFYDKVVITFSNDCSKYFVIYREYISQLLGALPVAHLSFRALSRA